MKEPGQWYLDRRQGKLYYIPLEGETAENILVEAPVLKEILKLSGSGEKYTEGIRFENIIFENTASDNNGKMPARTAHMFYDTERKYASSCQAAVNIGGAVIGMGRTMEHNTAVFLQNVIVFGEHTTIFGRSCVNFEDRTVIFDCNYYCGTSDPFMTVGEPNVKNNRIIPWDEWQGMGYDMGSHIVSDIFEQGTLNLKKDAEVFQYGFKR